MKKIKIEAEPKLQFNRGNPDSPAPSGIDHHDLTEHDENQITEGKSNKDLHKDRKKKQNVLDKKRIKESKAENTEMLTF